MKTNLSNGIITACTILSGCIILTADIARAQTDASPQQAKAWLKEASWSHGVTLKPHASVNAISFYQQYHAAKPLWDKVFEFIKTHDLEKLEPGKYVIDGDNAYAMITDAPSKTDEAAKWEAHQKYIDLQYVIRGKENIEVINIASATETVPYDAAKDVAKYSAKGTTYLAEPGTFFLFFPEDVHRPNILVNGYDTVKKMVIKIKVSK